MNSLLNSLAVGPEILWRLWQISPVIVAVVLLAGSVGAWRRLRSV